MTESSGLTGKERGSGVTRLKEPCCLSLGVSGTADNVARASRRVGVLIGNSSCSRGFSSGGAAGNEMGIAHISNQVLLKSFFGVSVLYYLYFFNFYFTSLHS